MIQIYHPSKSNTGFAASFWRNRDGIVFGTILKQSGWDEANQNGVFKDSVNDPNKKVNIKLSDIEVCAILDCIDRNRPFSTFHDNEETPKQIAFSPWKDKTSGDIKGYSFSVSVSNKQDSSFKNSFYIGLTFAEARLIREFLLFSLERSFTRYTLNQKTPYSPAPSSPDPAPNQPETTQEVKAITVDPLIDF